MILRKYYETQRKRRNYALLRSKFSRLGSRSSSDNLISDAVFYGCIYYNIERKRILEVYERLGS